METTISWVTACPRRPINKFAELLSPKKGAVCLDIASATGSLTLALADKVGPEGNVIGIDLAQAMLDYSERKARASQVEEYRVDTDERAESRIPGQHV